jgi:hypothetical protein
MTTETNGNGTTSAAAVEGVVRATNDRGVLLEGHSWLNVSRFAGGVLLPEVGAHVRLILDKSGFIRRVEPLEAPASAARVDTSPVVPVSTAASEPPDRDTRISRMACLNTATAILASGGRATDLAAVLAVAAELERWVLR